MRLPTSAFALLGLALAACVGSAAQAAEPALGGIVSAGKHFTCTPIMLWDGDGPIHCAEGPRVRLSGIAAREADGSCQPGHPCPGASATAARAKLASLLGRTSGTAPSGHLLIRGPALACTSDGSAGGKRTAAWCVSPLSGDLSCAMVASGTAARWGRYWRGHACGRRR
jgi:endonuclease YncB( thermonuclease family)